MLDEHPQVMATAAQLPERASLELTNALPRDAEAPADLREGLLGGAEAEPESEDRSLPGRKRREHALDLHDALLVQQRLRRRAGGGIFEELAQRTALADQRLQRERRTGRLENALDRLGRRAGAPGELLWRGFTARRQGLLATHDRQPGQHLVLECCTVSEGHRRRPPSSLEVTTGAG